MGERIELGVMPVFKKGCADNPAYVRALVRMLEAEDVDSVWAVEHVVVAKDYEPRYSYSPTGRMGGSPDVQMPDPLEYLAFAAACTERLLLGTAVVVATLHQPAILAKRVATLDALSGGRVRLGVGSGWQVEEYAACGVPYERRGARLDECIVAMRELWQSGHRTHEGARYAFRDVDTTILPAQAGGPPIIIGGSSEAAARRAGRLGDGFFPYVIGPDDLAERVGTIRTTAAEHGRSPEAVEITAWPGCWKPGSSLDVGVLREFAQVGCRRLVISAQESGSTDLDDIRAFVRRVRDLVHSL
jgi:probable F420-dependent oxidoreductase